MSRSHNDGLGRPHEREFNRDVSVSETFSIEVTESKWGEFWQLARDSLKAAENHEAERESIGQAGHDDGLGMAIVLRDQQVHVCLVFAAFAVEALINDYIFLKSPPGFIGNHLERLPTVAKYVFAVQWFTETKLDPSHEPVQGLQRMFELRNQLVHPKTQRGAPEEVDKTRVSITDAREVVATIEAAVRKLQELDPEGAKGLAHFADTEA